MRNFYIFLLLSLTIFATCVISGIVFSRNATLGKKIIQHKDQLQRQQKELSELKHVLELKNQQYQSAKQKIITLKATTDSLNSSLKYSQSQSTPKTILRPHQYDEEPKNTFIDFPYTETPKIRSRVFFRNQCQICD